MKELLDVRDRIRASIPGALLFLDIPTIPTGTHFLDVRHNHHFVVVEWRAGELLGVSDCGDQVITGFGDEEPEYRCASPDLALQKVIELLKKESQD